MHKLALQTGLVLGLIGCTSTSPSFVANDAELSKSSRAYHAFLMGELALKNNKPDQALTLLNQAERELGDGELHYRLAILNARNSDFDKAVTSAQKAVSLNSKYTSTLKKIEAVKNGSKIGAAILDQAESSLSGSSIENAIEDLSLAVGQNPQSGALRFMLARALVLAQRRGEAIAVLRKMSPEGDLFIEGKLYQAFLYKEEGSHDSALTVLKEARKSGRFSEEFALSYISLLRESGKIQEALQFVKESLVKHDSQILQREHAILSYETGDKATAEKELLKILSIKRDPDLLNFIAYSYAISHTAKNDRLLEAETLILEALAAQPNNPYFIDTLGVVRLKQGRLTAAREMFESASSKLNDDLVILGHLLETLILIQNSDMHNSSLAGEIKSVAERILVSAKMQQHLNHEEKAALNLAHSHAK